jgi:hypothetical protein
MRRGETLRTQGAAEVFLSAKSRPPSSVAAEIEEVRERRRALTAHLGALIAELDFDCLKGASACCDADPPHPVRPAKINPTMTAECTGLRSSLTREVSRLRAPVG